MEAADRLNALTFTILVMLVGRLYLRILVSSCRLLYFMHPLLGLLGFACMAFDVLFRVFGSMVEILMCRTKKNLQDVDEVTERPKRRGVANEHITCRAENSVVVIRRSEDTGARNRSSVGLEAYSCSIAWTNRSL